ncbi:MAG: hypothetical protein HZB38_14485 [Planctomycetes bacterium]|nr:hypothetical protein [Planctomycetota bacterium]
MYAFPRLAFSVAAGAVAASAETITLSPLVLDNQEVPEIGFVTSIDNLAINDHGQWIVEVDTDFPDTNTDGALIRTGSPYLREGDALAAPAGTNIDSFDSVTLNNSGQSGWNFFLGNATTGTDSGIFWGDQLVIQEGDLSAAPQFSPGTPYIGFFEVKINNANDMMVLASVDDPVIATTVDRALVHLTLNPDGSLAGEDVLYKEGDVLPGQVEAVADFLTGPHNFAFNDAGQTMFVADLTGDTTHDLAVYIDSTRIAQEGEPSPVTGRNWSSLGTARVGLNRFGQFVHTGTLAGDTATDNVIVSSRGVVKQEGDPIGAFTFTGFGSGPVLISDQGRVLWYGAWNDVSTTNEGLFLDDTLLVHEGVTTVEGVVVQTLRGIQDGYAMSANGRYVIFEATLADGRDGAFQIELSACPGEIAGDSMTDLSDLAALLASFGSCAGQSNFVVAADLDFDGCITLSDLATLLSAFGLPCP